MSKKSRGHPTLRQVPSLLKNTLYKIFVKRFSKFITEADISLYLRWSTLPLNLLGVGNTEVVGNTDLSATHTLARLDAVDIVRLGWSCILRSSTL